MNKRNKMILYRQYYDGYIRRFIQTFKQYGVERHWMNTPKIKDWLYE